MEGQEVTKVLVIEEDVETLKRGVYEYSQKLRWQAIATMQDHLSLPMEMFKCWFKAIDEQDVQVENRELQNTIAKLRSELEADQSKAMSQLAQMIEEMLEKQKDSQ